jgi:hypothetical protein
VPTISRTPRYSLERSSFFEPDDAKGLNPFASCQPSARS